MECTACGGDGCDQCDDGYFKLDQCPNSFCNDISDTIKIFDLFEKGLPPVTGGVLDQSAWFVNAERYYRHQETLAKAEE